MAAGRETGSLAGPGYRTVAPTVGLIPSVAGSTPPPWRRKITDRRLLQRDTGKTFSFILFE